MKKSLLALGLAAALGSMATQAAVVYDKDGTSMDIYGRIQAVYYSHDSGANNNDANDGNIVASGRLGVELATELNSYVTGIAGAEWDAADGDDNDTFSARTLFVGFDFGDFGTLQFGRFEDAVYQGVEAATDILDDWGCNGQFGNDDRRSGMAMYSWSGFGFDVMLSFGTAKDDQTVGGVFINEDESADIEYSYGLALGYTTPDVLFGPIGIKLGYGGAEFQTGSAYSDEDHGHNAYLDNYRHFAAALSWGNADEGLYLAALYTRRSFELNGDFKGTLDGLIQDDYDTTGIEAVVSYAFENGVTVMASYQYIDVDVDNGPDVEGQCLPIYVNYQINPNFQVWFEARFDLGTDDSKTNDNKNLAMVTNDVVNLEDNIFSVGARYTF